MALLFLSPSAGRQVYSIVGLGAGAAYLDGATALEAPPGVDPALEREIEESSRDELDAVIADAFD